MSAGRPVVDAEPRSGSGVTVPPRDAQSSTRPYVGPLLDEFTVYARAAGHTGATIAGRRKVIRQIVADLGDPLMVTAPALTNWFGHEGWTPWTRSTYRNAARSFFGFLVEYGHRVDNPAGRLRRPRMPASLPKPVSDAELAFLLDVSPEPWRTIVMLGAYAGLRVGEIAALRREDVSAETILIRRSKGGDPALVPTHPKLWAQLRDRGPGPVVRTPRGRTLTGKSISSRQRAYFDSIRLRAVHMHRLRHWFGTAVQRQQGDIRLTQELMRHRSITSTMIYTEVTVAAKVSAILALDAAA